MKPLYVLGLAWAIATGGAAAAPTADSDSATDNPYAQFDPDGVPLVVTQLQTRRRGGPTAQDMETARKREEQAVVDSNWLLRGYEEQLRLRNQPTPSQASSDLYLKLSTNKDLAKLAGLPQLDLTNGQDQAQPRTGTTSDPNKPATLRSASNTYTGYTFKPLITPLSSPALGSTTSPSASIASQMPSFFGSPAPAPRATPPRARVSAEPGELDTPGAMADRENPITEPAANDLTLDLLPGETVEQARAHAENNQDPHLPVLLNSDQLHVQQTASLKGAPRAVKPGQKAAAPPVAKPVAVDPAEEPMPIGQGATVTPVHAPIASPFDILNR